MRIEPNFDEKAETKNNVDAKLNEISPGKPAEEPDTANKLDEFLASIKPGEGDDQDSGNKSSKFSLLKFFKRAFIALILSFVVLAIGVIIWVSPDGKFVDTPTNAIVKTKEESLKTFVFSKFTTPDEFEIRYLIAEPITTRATVVLLLGRRDTIETFSETINKLYSAGIAVYALDWRGQGGSSRLVEPLNIGYVKSFAEYNADLNQFIDEIVKPNARTKLVMLANSMGANIGLNYLLDNPNVFASAIMLSPMWKLPISKTVESYISPLTKASRLLNYELLTIPGYGSDYYSNIEFDGNPYTRSPFRFGKMNNQYSENPELGIGGPSLNWINAAQESIKEIEMKLQQQRMRTPTLVALGESDRIVDTEKAANYAKSFDEGKLLRFIGARHQLFLEIDDVYNLLMSRSIKFIKQSMPIPRPKVHGKYPILLN